jgi:dTDP-4-dehydrorhamnose 3,5-epimerase-like enzyme
MKSGGPARMNDTLAGPSHGATDVVGAARLIDLPVVTDAKGALMWAQAGTHLPFEIQRFFCVFGVPAGEVRGQHAHRRLHQLLVCVQGRCTVTLDDGAARDRVVLDTPARGLHLPPLIWAAQGEFSADALLVVLASEAYRPEDYIHDYGEFLALARSRR